MFLKNPLKTVLKNWSKWNFKKNWELKSLLKLFFFTPSYSVRRLCHLSHSHICHTLSHSLWKLCDAISGPWLHRTFVSRLRLSCTCHCWILWLVACLLSYSWKAMARVSLLMSPRFIIDMSFVVTSWVKDLWIFHYYI